LVLLLGREQSSVLMKRQTPISPSTGPTVVLPESPTPALPVPIPDPQIEKAPAVNSPLGAPAPNADRSAINPAPKEPVASEPAPTAPAAAVPTPPASTSSGASPVSPPVGSPIQEPLVLALEATELSWVVVQVDDGSPHEALLRPGERITWNASDRFVVTLGNAGGVSVELNGEPKGPFGPSGTVARDIVLTR
ncbi:MAG: RodZ domain-containing protein, partial [Nitrospirales bacterium]